ncbi:transcription regulator (exsB) [Mycolicibacterium phlei RIVM601174]|nr:transcription regulator (exsB) [Mycolicibacterium phlei RIVM601174]
MSGGVDSAVLLAHLKASGDEVIALSVHYGQTHARELQAAIDLAKHYNVDHRIVSLKGVFANSALTGDVEIPEQHAESPDATVVPGRNIVLISLASAIAAAEGAAQVMFGANADDFGGYPDCRHDFVMAMNEAVSRGTGFVAVSAPFQSMTKRQVVDLGRELGVPFGLTWSCYRGGTTPCGRCGACISLKEANFDVLRQ